MRRFRSVRIVAFAALTSCVIGPGGSAPFFAHSDPSEPIASLTARIAQEPENADLRIARGQLHRIDAEWSEAAADFRAARELDPSLDVADLLLGATLTEAGLPERAEPFLDRYLAHHPHDVYARITRARARGRLGQHLAAAGDWRVAISHARRSGTVRPEHYLELSHELVAAGETHMADALEVLAQGSAELGSPVTLELAALEIEVELGRTDDALGRIEVLERRATRKESWAVRRGRILESAGRPAEARRAFGEALAAIERLAPGRRDVPSVRELESEARAARVRLREHPADPPGDERCSDS